MGNTVENEKYSRILFITPEKLMRVQTSVVRTSSPFRELFPIKQSEYEKIKKSMYVKGYDVSHPIVVWGGHNMTVVDGHTRLAAAKELDFLEIPVIVKEFKDEAEALEYAINSQVNRRNLTDQELMNCLHELDIHYQRGGNSKASREAFGKSAEKTAELLGISRAKVERLRAISDHASPELMNAVKQSRISANKAYNATMAARKAAQETEKSVLDDENTREQLAGIRLERLSALRKSLIGFMEKRVEREIQEFPEIRYTTEEIASVIGDAKKAVEENLYKLISKEN